jgi:uncharacterized membrane protein
MVRKRKVSSDDVNGQRRKSGVTIESLDIESRYAFLKRLDTKVDQHHRRHRFMLAIITLVVLISEILGIIAKFRDK